MNSYDAIVNEGAEATEQQTLAIKIINEICHYGGFDNAWYSTNYKEEIFDNIVDLLS